MRAKFIYEKFTLDSDPIKDMGIGSLFYGLEPGDALVCIESTPLSSFKYQYLKENYIAILDAKIEHGILTTRFICFSIAISRPKKFSEEIINKGERALKSFCEWTETAPVRMWEQYFKIIKAKDIV